MAWVKERARTQDLPMLPWEAGVIERITPPEGLKVHGDLLLPAVSARELLEHIIKKVPMNAIV
eukprot:11170021-Lingulodinium_polyedra.AAC.1